MVFRLNIGKNIHPLEAALLLRPYLRGAVGIENLSHRKSPTTYLHKDGIDVVPIRSGRVHQVPRRAISDRNRQLGDLFELAHVWRPGAFQWLTRRPKEMNPNEARGAKEEACCCFYFLFLRPNEARRVKVTTAS